MTEEKGTVILTAIFNEGGPASPEYKEYSERSTANFKAYGGVIKNQFQIEKNLGNGSTPSGVFLAEFPTKEKAIEAFTSDEYKAILPLRDVAFKEVSILISKN